MSGEVYITGVSKFLPNRPVSNDEMESYLGMINNTPSKARRIVLRNNGIKTRYYAISDDGRPTHNNAEMAAASIEKLFINGISKNDIELLACGTATPDQIMPSHASMVHGVLRCPTLRSHHLQDHAAQVCRH
jgi:3-oxoacyl-[acyl-carrier-protein] synthase-3